MLANATSQQVQQQLPERYRHVGTTNFMAEAVSASERIPEELSAADAADDFLLWMIGNLRVMTEGSGEMPEIPEWFKRD